MTDLAHLATQVPAAAEHLAAALIHLQDATAPPAAPTTAAPAAPAGSWINPTAVKAGFSTVFGLVVMGVAIWMAAGGAKGKMSKTASQAGSELIAAFVFVLGATAAILPWASGVLGSISGG